MKETNEDNKPVVRGLTLAQLVQHEQELMTKIYEAEGEVTEEIQQMLAISEKTLPEKIDAYAHMIDRLEIEMGRLDLIVDQYEAMSTKLKRSRDWMRENMKNAMKTLEVRELKGIDKRFVLMSAAPKLEVNTDYITADYMREKFEYVVDKEAVKKALERGTVVPGARLIESEYVRVYSNAPEVSAGQPKAKRATKAKGEKEALQ